MKTPLGLHQASTLCQQFQFLLGSLFDPDMIGKGKIECIAVAPFDESKQWLFAQYYLETRNAEQSLRFYRGHEYDVLILSVPYLRKRTINYCDLRTYQAKVSILQESPVLASAR